MKKWVKWLLLGASAAVAAFVLTWCILLCFGFNIFAPKGWQDGKYLNNMGKPLTGWQTIDGKTWHFAADGQKTTGWLETEQGRYYLTETGIHTGWLSDETGTYLLKPDGSVCTGWVDTDSGLRYFDETGLMAVGFQQDQLWYFEADGKPFDGWFENRCYGQGQALTGWQELEEQRYYFLADGTAACGWQSTGRPSGS